MDGRGRQSRDQPTLVRELVAELRAEESRAAKQAARTSSSRSTRRSSGLPGELSCHPRPRWCPLLARREEVDRRQREVLTVGIAELSSVLYPELDEPIKADECDSALLRTRLALGLRREATRRNIDPYIVRAEMFR